MSYAQVYMEKVYDLLKPGKTAFPLKVVEDEEGQVKILDLTVKSIVEAEDLLELINSGNKNRKVDSHKQNSESSRSHSILTITLKQKKNSKVKLELDGSTIRSELKLIDLAGSEKLGKTECSGLNEAEGKKINLSLLSLGKIMNQLTQKETGYISFRESIITRLLSNIREARTERAYA